MRIAGAISGTSHDGIDVAVVEFRHDGDRLEARLLAEASTPYSPALRARLLAALPPASTTLAEVTALDTLIGQEFAEAVAALVRRTGAVDLVASHGQTVYHWVEEGVARGSLQLGQAAWIAEAVGAPVLSELRMRDVAAGGQGAPIVPLLDRLLLAGLPGTAAALNLGGIANLTVLRDGEATAWDIGPANALVDAAVLESGLHPAGFDADGAIAASGTVDPGLLDLLLEDPYYARPAPKSTGKEHFNADYLRAARARLGRPVADADLVATLTELTVRTVAAAALAAGATSIAVSGGGRRNPVMMAGLAAALPGVTVAPSDELGVPSDAKEAIAMALIAWFTAHGLPGSVPAATGASGARLLGSLTAGALPLRLPAPLETAPSRLVMAAPGPS